MVGGTNLVLTWVVTAPKCPPRYVIVIGLDIADQALDEAKRSGADHVFNSMTEKDWQKKIVEITGGGVDAAVNFTASKKSYNDAPAII